MNKSETSEIVVKLMTAYPRQEITPETLETYCQMLGDLDAEAAMRAAVEHMATSKYFPTIAEIRTAVVEAELQLPPTDEAYTEVIRRIRKVGRDGLWTSDLCPAVVDAVKAVGWLSMCNSTAPGVERAAFVKFYEAAKERAIQDRNLKPLLEGAAVKGLLSG